MNIPLFSLPDSSELNCETYGCILFIVSQYVRTKHVKTDTENYLWWYFWSRNHSLSLLFLSLLYTIKRSNQPSGGFCWFAPFWLIQVVHWTNYYDEVMSYCCLPGSGRERQQSCGPQPPMGIVILCRFIVKVWIVNFVGVCKTTVLLNQLFTEQYCRELKKYHVRLFLE